MEPLAYQAAEHLIKQLYLSILNRKADSEGLKFHTERLQKMGIYGYPSIVQDFLNSDEYQSLFKKKIQNNQLSQLPCLYQIGKQQNKTLINHLISLGDHCLTSALLKRYHLKQYSLPFDWVFSNLEAVLHCIEDDFDTFVDQQYLVAGMNPTNNLATQHLFYEENFNVDRFMFNHMDITQPENRNYILRTVHRFRQLLQSSEPKVFLHLAKPDKKINENFERCIQVLQRHTNNFHVIIIQLKHPSDSSSNFSLNLVKQIDNHKYYEYLPISQENGTEFEDQFDELILMKALSEFDFQLVNI